MTSPPDEPGDATSPNPRPRLSDAEAGHLWRVRWRRPDSDVTREAIFSRRGQLMRHVFGRVDAGCVVVVDRGAKPIEFADEPASLEGGAFDAL